VELLPCGLFLKREGKQLNLKTEQIKKYSNYVKIIGISIMILYVSFGVYAYIVSDNSCSYSVFCSALTDAFADKNREGINHKITLSDGIEMQDTLKTKLEHTDQSTEGNNYLITITDSIEASEVLR